MPTVPRPPFCVTPEFTAQYQGAAPFTLAEMCIRDSSKTMIYDEVALGLQRSGLTEEQIREKVEATLRVCGLYPFRN